ncbi:MAG: cysteine-rich CWC family protein [Methylococcales bacterium]|nr:cysteine-rich CWC family protein [Methylococcales bacterium]
MECNEKKSVISPKKHCVSCGKLFSCYSTKTNSCWCMTYPAIMPIKEDETDCLCRACLSEAIQKKMVDKLSHLTLAEKLSLARGYKTKVKAIEGIDYNMEKGKYVFTQWHHLKRGACCNHKCKLCPY